MKLTHMAREEGEGAEIGTAIALSPYPWGLKLHLTHEELEKLGYDELPPAGTVCRVEAVAVVTRSASEDPDADGDCDFCSIELQVTELGMEEEDGYDEEEDEEGPAHRLYGKKE